MEFRDSYNFPSAELVSISFQNLNKSFFSSPIIWFLFLHGKPYRKPPTHLPADALYCQPMVLYLFIPTLSSFSHCSPPSYFSVQFPLRAWATACSGCQLHHSRHT
jgi:hypothetical protein